MKTYILLFFTFFLINNLSFSQQYWDYSITFEDTSQFFRVEIDTIAYLNNKWQIGIPNKQSFNSAFSGTNVIITDTINSYPANDTSVFIIKHMSEGQGFTWPHTVIIAGKYKINSDTLTDYGQIEFSPDNGETWINLITDTVYASMYSYSWYSPKPVLSGNVSTWTDFYVNIAGFGYIFNIPYGDTVLYRFSFISDSIQTNKEGWMLDNLHFEDWAEDVPENDADNIVINLYPNPATDYITLDLDKRIENYSYIIFNSEGVRLQAEENLKSESIRLKTDKFRVGIYYLSLIDINNKRIRTKKIVIK